VILLPSKTKVLFGAKEVERLEVNKNRKLGEGHQGKLFFGRLKLKGERTRQVAVKYFRTPSEQEIHEAFDRIGGTRFIPTDHALKGQRLRHIKDIICYVTADMAPVVCL